MAAHSKRLRTIDYRKSSDRFSTAVRRVAVSCPEADYHRAGLPGGYAGLLCKLTEFVPQSYGRYL